MNVYVKTQNIIKLVDSLLEELSDYLVDVDTDFGALSKALTDFNKKLNDAIAQNIFECNEADVPQQ